MGWREVQLRYSSGKTMATQATEDLVARRVLQGLGYTAKELGMLEKRLHTKYVPDAAMWPRVLEALRSLCSFSRRQYLFGLDDENPGMFAIDVREVDSTHTEILEMRDFFENHVSAPHPLFLTRVKDTKISRAYYLLRNEDGEGDMYVPWLSPPVAFIGQAGPWWIACQETSHFIQQLGPFTLPLTEENHE